jgi:hypothetical protein
MFSSEIRVSLPQRRSPAAAFRRDLAEKPLPPARVRGSVLRKSSSRRSHRRETILVLRPGWDILEVQSAADPTS